MNHTKSSIASKTDDVFWVSLRNRERDGLEGVYFLLSRRLFQMGMSVLKDEDFIVDCVQEVFLNLCAIVLAWPQKAISFQNVPITEVVRVLENRYGVHISYSQKPRANLKISGKFHHLILKNVLKGMSDPVRFDFDINQDNVLLTFKN